MLLLNKILISLQIFRCHWATNNKCCYIYNDWILSILCQSVESSLNLFLIYFNDKIVKVNWKKLIPMPVLYGVFMYMGVTSLSGIQLVNRIGFIFKPVKHQPDDMLLRHVKLTKVHLFTMIQIFTIAVMFLMQSSKLISILFPVMVIF